MDRGSIKETIDFLNRESEMRLTHHHVKIGKQNFMPVHDFLFLKIPLTHYQTTNFGFFQTDRVCRQQFQIRRKWQQDIQTRRKHCGMRRNCSLRTISPFLTVFSKVLFPRGVKRCHCVGMG